MFICNEIVVQLNLEVLKAKENFQAGVFLLKQRIEQEQKKTNEIWVFKNFFWNRVKWVQNLFVMMVLRSRPKPMQIIINLKKRQYRYSKEFHHSIPMFSTLD